MSAKGDESLSRRHTLLCQMCHICPCPSPSPAPTAPAQHSPAPTHIPYTQHLVNTPSPYTHILVHTAHSPCTSLCLPHTPNPDHIHPVQSNIRPASLFAHTQPSSCAQSPNYMHVSHLTLPHISALEICFLRISLHCTCCYAMSLYSRGCS